MKLYEFVDNLKKLKPNKIVMIKVGAFFNSIGKDAIELEKILGLKRTCFAKGICRVGIPVNVVREKTEILEKKLREKNINIIIYDEKPNGRYKFKDKTYDVILDINGQNVVGNEENIDCSNCKQNIYADDKAKYISLKKDLDEIIKKLDKMYKIN